MFHTVCIFVASCRTHSHSILLSLFLILQLSVYHSGFYPLLHPILWNWWTYSHRDTYHTSLQSPQSMNCFHYLFITHGVQIVQQRGRFLTTRVRWYFISEESFLFLVVPFKTLFEIFRQSRLMCLFFTQLKHLGPLLLMWYFYIIAFDSAAPFFFL